MLETIIICTIVIVSAMLVAIQKIPPDYVKDVWIMIIGYLGYRMIKNGYNGGK